MNECHILDKTGHNLEHKTNQREVKESINELLVQTDLLIIPVIQK